MNRSLAPSLAAGVVLAVILGTPVLRCAEGETPAPAAKPPASKTPAQEPLPAKPLPPRDAAPQSGPSDPAGMVRFPGGKVKLGMTRKALDALIKATEIGRMAHQAGNVEDCYSISTPEYEVVLPPFWIGKYEVTNAQWHRFLQAPGVRVTYVVPEKGKPGAATLDQIARMHLLAPEFDKAGGGKYYPVANDWKAIYELNEQVLNPVAEGEDPKKRPAPETFKDRVLPPGTKILTFRWSVPLTWRARPGGPLLAAPPPWMEEMPVTTVSWADAMAFAEYYGCHLPTEQEWEAACRGPKGEIWPEGGDAMDPLAHAWKGFNNELLKAQEEAKKLLPAADKRVAEAVSGTPAMAEALAVKDRLDKILAMREIAEDPPFTIVGAFPFGRSPCGAMDMIGNVEEWVSTTNVRYPGTDTKSKWADADAHILRGGNTIYRDSLLTATYRAILFGDLPLMKHMKFTTAGFRVARYETPGASSASHIVEILRQSAPPILPREEEKGTRNPVGPGLDPYRATGIERYREVPWSGTQAAKNDPPGKVFLLGPSQGLCVLPATGIPHRDPSAVKEAASKNAVPAKGDGKTAKADKRQPRDIPFFGLLHLSEGIEVKGFVRTTKTVQVAIPAKERKEMLDRWKEARKKKPEPTEEKPKEDPPKDGGDPAPKDKMEGKPAPKGGKGGGKPADGDPPPEGEGDAPEGDKPEDDPDEPKIPTHRDEQVTVHEQGFASGDRYPGGFLLGFIKVGEDSRAVLWEPRIGSVGSTAPGGTVMLEEPLVILPKDSIDFKKVSKPGAPVSTLEATSGEVKLVFYLPVEGKDTSSWFEVTLKLSINFDSQWNGGPWVTLPPKAAQPPK